MKVEKWFQALTIASGIALVALLIMVPVFAEREELNDRAVVLVVFLFVSLPLCATGSFATIFTRKKFAVLPALLGTFILHLGIIIIIIMDWTNEDCTENLITLCTSETTNFFLVFLFDVFLNLGFAGQYYMLWKMWKLLNKESFPQQIPNVDEEDLSVEINF